MDDLRDKATRIISDESYSKDVTDVAVELVKLLDYREQELRGKDREEKAQRILEQGGNFNEQFEVFKDRKRLSELVLTNTLGRVRIIVDYKYYDLNRPDFQAGAGLRLELVD